MTETIKGDPYIVACLKEARRRNRDNDNPNQNKGRMVFDFERGKICVEQSA